VSKYANNSPKYAEMTKIIEKNVGIKKEKEMELDTIGAR
jgi:hypothetical protein